MNEYETRRNAALYEAKDKDGPVASLPAKWFYMGYDAGQRDTIAEFRRRVEEKVAEYRQMFSPLTPECVIDSMAEVEKEMNERGS